MKMATKLKRLKIRRVAFVDEGANPDAFIRFAKAKEAQPDETEQGIIKRAMSVLAKAFGIDLEKGARTFAEAVEARDYDVVMDKEIYPMHWAMMDSVRSILTDGDIDDTTKETLLKQTLAEYSEAYIRAVPAWAKAELSNELVSKEDGTDMVPALTKVRDHLNELIEKGCGGKKPVKKEDDLDDPDDGPDDDSDDGPEEPDEDVDKEDGCGKKPRVKKGATDMNFDTSKMSPEELATYNDLAKRFGTEEPQTPPTPEPHAPEAPKADDNDVYKGLHPAVKAELESLRKFREDSEMRELTEVAKKYTLLGKKPEELAPVLKSLRDAGGTAYADMISILDSNLEAVEKSGLYGEIGKRGTSGSTTDDAWGKIEAAAREIAKAKPEMAWHEAVDAACAAHPDLLEDYEKSRY